MLMKPASSQDDYIGVSPYCLNFLVGDSTLYLKNERTGDMKCYSKRGQRPSQAQINALHENDVQKLYIHRDEYQQAIGKIQKNLSNLLGNETIPLEHRAIILHDTTKERLRETLETKLGDVNKKTLKTLNELVVSSFEFISKADAMKAISNLISHDNATYIHSLNVFLYTMMLFSGIPEKILSKDKKIQYGVGALLHDIGKIQIPGEIINKPGKLTSEEFDIIKRHPELGIKDFEGLDISEQIYNAILFHHEKMNGQGYPSQMQGEAIPLGVRAIAIADVFEALTADRPYRPAMPIKEALDIMVLKMEGHFDKTLLKLFIQKLIGKE